MSSDNVGLAVGDILTKMSEALARGEDPMVWAAKLNEFRDERGVLPMPIKRNNKETK